MQQSLTILDQRLQHWAARQPDTAFLIEAETGRTLTYGECRRAVTVVRRLLGAQPGVVALVLPNGIANSLVWLAALTSGHLLVPVAPDAPDAERAQIGQRTPPDTVVVQQAQDADGFGRPGARVVTLGDIEAALAGGDEGAFPLAPSSSGRVCLTTSGTTGEPKVVVLTAGQLAGTAEQVRISHRLLPADRVLSVLPFYHINAPVVSLCATLMAGGSAVIARRFSRRHLWDWIDAYQVTWASIVPTIVAMLLDTERPGWLPGRLRFVRTASAPLPVAHLDAFERRFGIPVVETYGLSEAASQVTANPVPPGERRRGSVGLPTGLALRVCRPRYGDLRPPLTTLPAGEVGEICVAGPNLIRGYEGGAGAAAFQDGWFRTGDLGYRDRDGYVYIAGRLKEVIKRGGETIAPREIEEVVLAYPGVADAAAIGEPDPLYGERVVLYVVPAGLAGPDLPEAVQRHCLDRLSGYKVPAEVIVTGRLPRNQNGKLNRARLQALAAD